MFLLVCLAVIVPAVLAVKLYRALPPEEEASDPADTVPARQLPVSVPEAPRADEPVSAAAGLAEQERQQDGEPAQPDSTADAPDYQRLYPDFYAPQPYSATERIENTVYLTFDDGPSDQTDRILKTLSEKGVKATFFVTGKSDEADLERMRRIVEAGHSIGMHSFSHNYDYVYASMESFLDDFYRNFLQIREATGITPAIFRFPGGSVNSMNEGLYQEMISEMMRRGFVPYDWNVSSEDAVDAKLTPADTLVRNVTEHARGKVRAFVLFHDSAAKSTSASAVGPVIDQLREMGFSFDAITPNTLPVLFPYRSAAE